jgi:hypothetical protein
MELYKWLQPQQASIAPAQAVTVREIVDLDVVMVAVAVGGVLAQVRRELPRCVAVVQVRLRRPPVHDRMQPCVRGGRRIQAVARYQRQVEKQGA